jgi:hypothetical protein
MKKLLLFTLLAGLSPLPFLSSTAAQEPAAKAGDSPSPEKIVEMVMMSRSLGKENSKDGITFPGELNRGGKSVPFRIQVLPTLIHFSFDNPKQNINLDTTEKGYRLREVTAGSNKEVPTAMYSAGVRGTDLTYDDISMRYLYWPKKVNIGEESIKTRKCYVVDLYNPQKLGDYYLVRIFVDKESGGLMRMMGFDWNGKLIKSCSVTAGMKVNGSTVMKTMEVIRYVPGTKKVAGETTFELKKP